MTTKQPTLISSKTRKTYFGAKCHTCKKVIRLKQATWNTADNYVTYKYSCSCGFETRYLYDAAKVITPTVNVFNHYDISEIPF